MDKILKRYIIPLGLLIVGSFLINFMTGLFPNVITPIVYYFLVTLMLFTFGFTLNNEKTRLKSFTWRHIIIILLLVFLFLYDTNMINISFFNWFRKFVISDIPLIQIIYVYFGWLFSQR